ncbi:MAG: hypothetical protein ACOX6T_17085 [Myxococcales bacterium]|jgi:hypothetical protein
MRRGFIVVTAALVVAAACLVPEVDLTGKACDSEHPCSEGFRCVDGTCVAPLADAGVRPETDGGLPPDAGTPGCLEGSIACVDGRRVGCEDGEQVVIEDCAAAGALCDATLGCLTPCGAGEECPAGRACDGATELCLERPSCADDLDCAGEARCASGACLAPSAEVTVTTPNGTELADLSCYPLAEAPVGAEVTLRGLLVSASGMPVARTIGYSLKLYRAADWAADAAPLAEVTVGSTDDGSGGEAGGFEIASVPTDEELVAASAGKDGVPTYQYFRVPSQLAVAGVVDRFNLVSHERALWQSLVASAGATVVEGRAGIDGQVFDCRNPSRRVAGATASLDVLSRSAYYTLPGLVAIDPGASATANNGRFFFFDVPVMSVGIAVGLGPDLVIHRAVRTVEDSVTVFSVAP